MKRLLTAVLLIPCILYVVYFGPFWLLFGVTALVAVICFSEYSGIAAAYGVEKAGPIGYAAGLLVLVMRPQDTLLALTLLALAALTLALRVSDLAKLLPQAAFLFFGIVYIFGAWRFAILLRGQSAHWLAYALVLNWIGDGCAYYTGKSLGRHKLAARISPQKTWEGSAASLAGSVIFGVLYLTRVLGVPPIEAGLLSVAANVAGQAGDLAESGLKRGAGVKDSSSLLPGHGGLLDRVDSTLFALPVVYLKLYLDTHP
ncbi:MAG TPA: phosphatidate cytidylyltransferase [Bryobacteraceae bacterium]|nr:phosphatidate cytidylyltransferase [Bryobacteraceae bacterium]